MAEHKEHTPKQKSQPNLDQQINDGAVQMGNVQFEDNRQTSISQLQAQANNSPQVDKTAQLQAMANAFLAKKQGLIQKKIMQTPVYQFVKDLPPKSYVEIDTGGHSLTGQIVNARANDYDIQVGGTDTINTYPENVVSVHSAVAGVREKQDEEVGDLFENQKSIYVAMNKFKRSKGRMHTDGLANCIAVVAFHEATKVASFTHYDTMACFHMVEKVEEDYGDFDDESAYKPALNPPKLEALKARMLLTLGITSGVKYYIALGGMWSDGDPKIVKQKGELIHGLNQAFNPTELQTNGTKTAYWDPLFKGLN